MKTLQLLSQWLTEPLQLGLGADFVLKARKWTERFSGGSADHRKGRSWRWSAAPSRPGLFCGLHRS